MASSSETVPERVIEIINQQLGVEVQPSHDFVFDLGADSLDKTEIALEIEEEFDIVLADQDVENARTVQNFIDIVNNRKKQE